MPDNDNLTVIPGGKADWRDVLSKRNRDSLEALAEAYGITEEAAINVAVSDAYDSKVAAMRDAEGE